MRRFFAFLMAATMMVGAAACSDDEEGGNDAPPGMLQVGEMPYALGAAYCQTDVVEDRFVRYDIFLTDKVYWDDEGNWPDDYAAYVNAIEVNLYFLYAETNSTNSILSGTYTYAGEDGKHLTHSGGSDYVICDETGWGSWIAMGQQLVETSQLKIEINHISGSTYEIIFTGGVDEEGNAVSGYYKGKVDIVEL